MSTTTGFKQDNLGSYIIKDPRAELNYTIDWTDWLGSDTITASTWSITTYSTSTVNTSALTQVNASIAVGSKKTTITVNSGTVGNIYNVRNTIDTANDLTESRAFRIKVDNRLL
jgi:hypothetical protein